MPELQAQRRPRGNTLFWRIYMLSWAFLAGGALTYMSAFVLHPGNQGKILSDPASSNQESNRAELDRAQLTAKVRSLHNTIASLQSDLARIKDSRTETATAPAAPEPAPQDTKPADSAFTQETSNLTTASIPTTKSALSETVTRALATPATETALPQVKAPEASPATISNAAPTTATTTRPTILNDVKTPSESSQVSAALAPTKPRKRGNFATTPLKSGSAPPLPISRGLQRTSSAAPLALNPSLLNSSPVAAIRANQIRTGSLPQVVTPSAPTQIKPAIISKPSPNLSAAAPSASNPPVFGTPTVKPRKTSATAAALALSSAGSVTGLRASWLLLTTRHRETFTGYQPRYVADPVTGNYRLLAGPIASRAEADRVCTELRAKSINCGVAIFSGTPL